MADPYQGSHQQYGALCHPAVMVPMRDGVLLATDVYRPAVDGAPAAGRSPVILERTPYNKRSPVNVTQGEYFARRGYVCAIQDVRGRFESEGEWYPFAREAPDGFDTTEWLGTQPWSDGRVGTMGASYAGSDQSALATLDPPHLATMIVAVGASNYYHSSMRQNGALEQRFLAYAYRMAVTSKEALADPDLRREVTDWFMREMPDAVRGFPVRAGATILARFPSYERWAVDILTHGEYGDYWKQRGYAISEYYDQHADVPHALHRRLATTHMHATPCESYIALSSSKKEPQRLLMGPWTHGKWDELFSGDAYFGTESHIDYNDLRLAWFDCYLKGMRTQAADWPPVRIFVMGTGDGSRAVLGAPGEKAELAGRLNHGGYWRDEPDWPLPETAYTPYYLHGDGSLSTQTPDGAETCTTTFDFDPGDPVPTMGGGISAADLVMLPGAFDQRGRPDFFGCKDTEPLSLRRDVLSFETPLLEADLEVTGPIEMHLWAASSAVDTDFTAKLIDLYPPAHDYPDGIAPNLTDSIIRVRYRSGWERPELMKPGEPYELVFQLYPTSNVFKSGHRIRLDISSSNWPRFDVNPNTGGPLGLETDQQVATQTVYHDPERPSHVVLPVHRL